jgi:hypothetical protein
MCDALPFLLRAALLSQAMNPETSPDTSMGLVHAYYSYQPLQLGEAYGWAGLTLLLLLALGALLGRKLRRAGTRMDFVARPPGRTHSS